MNLRRFRVPEGRALTLPIGLLPGPGAMNMRLDAGAIFELDMDDKRTRQHQRFLAILVKDGDIVETSEAATPVAPTASSPAKPFEVNPPTGGK